MVMVIAVGSQGCGQVNVTQERQLLNDSIAYYSQQIQNIVGVIQQRKETSEKNQKNLLHDIDSLDRCMKAMILRFGERNKDNELGREILENYNDEST
jgi:hypothetical protein